MSMKSEFRYYSKDTKARFIVLVSDIESYRDLACYYDSCSPKGREYSCGLNHLSVWTQLILWINIRVHSIHTCTCGELIIVGKSWEENMFLMVFLRFYMIKEKTQHCELR
jgi:hypothetical protein